jgi:hypothetical protein
LEFFNKDSSPPAPPIDNTTNVVGGDNGSGDGDGDVASNITNKPSAAPTFAPTIKKA